MPAAGLNPSLSACDPADVYDADGRWCARVSDQIWNVVNPVFSQDHKNLDAVQKPRAAIKRASAFFQVLLQL